MIVVEKNISTINIEKVHYTMDKILNKPKYPIQESWTIQSIRSISFDCFQSMKFNI